MKISIICPLYKGKKYIENIVNIAVRNYDVARKQYKIYLEVIFVNDYIYEKIEVNKYNLKGIKVKLIENEKNKGIHFSRVRGLEKAEGEYIIFLDQDDDISDDYIISQLSNIGECDAIVCNGINMGHKIYYSKKNMKTVCEEREYLNGKNLIISPGQVLIRKDAIPTEWRNNLLKNNGADDYFLWMLMLLKKKKIEYNYDVLYKHNSTGENTSNNFKMMTESVNEMMAYLYSEKLVTQLQYNRMKDKYGAAFKSIDNVFRLYERSSRVQIILDTWLTNKESNKSFHDFLKKNNINSVVIYGYGVLGRHLYNELGNINVDVEAIIDKDRNKGVDEIETINIGDDIPLESAIVITPVIEANKIKEKLEKYYNNKIFYIIQLVENMN